MTRLILIRHGQTAWNKEERVRGQVEIPLDDTGLAQAETTAERVVAEYRPVAIYSSPLQRAVQTAEAIARRIDGEVHPVAGLNDMNFGEWQGLTLDEVSRRWPDLANAWFRTPNLVTFPGGESLDRLRDRSMATIAQLIQEFPDEQIAVVGHMVVNRVLLLAMLGLDNSNYWRIAQGNCAISVIDWRGGVFYIVSVNDVSHLRRHQPGRA